MSSDNQNSDSHDKNNQQKTSPFFTETLPQGTPQGQQQSLELLGGVGEKFDLRHRLIGKRV